MWESWSNERFREFRSSQKGSVFASFPIEIFSEHRVVSFIIWAQRNCNEIPVCVGLKSNVYVSWVNSLRKKLIVRCPLFKTAFSSHLKRVTLIQSNHHSHYTVHRQPTSSKGSNHQNCHPSIAKALKETLLQAQLTIHYYQLTIQQLSQQILVISFIISQNY